jgi:CheY-like chemotaxis protein
MPAKILVVEGQSDYREILRAWIQILGHDVIEARSGEEAVEQALADSPQLIIMELELPGIDGIETIRRLKADPETAEIPLVVHSIWNPEDRVKGLGIEAFFTKPVSPQALKEVIERILGR